MRKETAVMAASRLREGLPDVLDLGAHGVLLVVEREVAAEKLESHDPGGPDVTCGSDLGAEHLRGHEPRGALHANVVEGELLGTEGPSEAKVDRLEWSLLGRVEQQEVLLLHVEVQDPVAVALSQRAQHGPHDARDGVLAVVLLAEGVEELSAAAVLHHEVHALVVLERFLEVRDVQGPAEPAHDFDLVSQGSQTPLNLQVGDAATVSIESLRHGLARKDLAGSFVGSQAHVPMAPLLGKASTEGFIRFGHESAASSGTAGQIYIYIEREREIDR